MLSKIVQRALTGWEAHGSRILKTTFRTKKWRINLNVIQCYAPTNDINENVKEEFYIQNCPRRNIPIMIGGFNAKTGRDNRGYEETIESQKIHLPTCFEQPDY